MLGRGLSKDLNAVYDKIILKAKKFELYSELVEVLYLKQIYLGFRRGKTEFENLIEDIRISEKSRDHQRHAITAEPKFWNGRSWRSPESSLKLAAEPTPCAAAIRGPGINSN